METPKPPASSELRRPSTRPYTRRKRAATVRDTDALAEGTSEAPSGAAGEEAATALAVAQAVATAVSEAVSAVESELPAKPSKSKTTKPRSRAKTQPASPIAIAVASSAPIGSSAASATLEEDTLDLTLDAVDIEAAVAALTDVTLEAKPLEDCGAAPLSLHAHAQIDASIDVIETLIVDMLDITRPISAPMQQMLIAQQNAEPLFTELPSPRQLPVGAPTELAPPPGFVPRGDSRSLRRGELFALVYRVHCFVVTRHGKVGQQGHWSAVEYPTPTSASHAYARGCSHWVSEGFSDYRG